MVTLCREARVSLVVVRLVAIVIANYKRRQKAKLLKLAAGTLAALAETISTKD